MELSRKRGGQTAGRKFGHPQHGGLKVLRLHGQVAGKPLAGFPHRQEAAAGAKVQAAEIPRHRGLELLAPGIAG